MRLALTVLACAAAASCAPNAGSHNSEAARGVIERSRVQASFTDASTSEVAAIRHNDSGLVCELPHDGAFQVEVFPDNAINQGAACTSSEGSAATTFVAVKFSESVALDRAFADSVAASAHLQGPTSWRGAPNPQDDAVGMPAFRLTKLEGRSDGLPVYLRVAMGQAGDWFVQQIVYAPLDHAAEVDDAAARQWRRVLIAAGHQQAGAAGAPPH